MCIRDSFQPEALPKQAEHSTLAQSIWREVAEWDTRERGQCEIESTQ